MAAALLPTPDLSSRNLSREELLRNKMLDEAKQRLKIARKNYESNTDELKAAELKKTYMDSLIDVHKIEQGPLNYHIVNTIGAAADSAAAKQKYLKYKQKYLALKRQHNIN